MGIERNMVQSICTLQERRKNTGHNEAVIVEGVMAPSDRLATDDAQGLSLSRALGH